jgi:hypothetical protein
MIILEKSISIPGVQRSSVGCGVAQWDAASLSRGAA